jgi:D-lactate dehydrogenase
MLSDFDSLPIAAEYLHRTCFDIAEKYGKDTFVAIRWLGTSRLPGLYRLKAQVDRIAGLFGFKTGISDRLLQSLSYFLPRHLPWRMHEFRDRYEHHLLLRVADEGILETSQYLARNFPTDTGDYFACTLQEGAEAFLHRFAAAGAAVRYKAIHGKAAGEIAALDVALPRNCLEWREDLPPELKEQTMAILYYGHFFCHVFHQDYILKPGCDWRSFEDAVLARLHAKGARYPAEHNVGHLYDADPAQRAFFHTLDPTNSFNPGVGKTSKAYGWS